MYEIYEQIVPGDITTQTYNGVLTAFDTHFALAVNYSCQCYVFRQMKQLPDEALHQKNKKKLQNAILLTLIEKYNNGLN